MKEVLSLPKVCVIVSPDTSRLMSAKKADLAFINFKNVRSDADRDTTYRRLRLFLLWCDL